MMLHKEDKQKFVLDIPELRLQGKLGVVLFVVLASFLLVSAAVVRASGPSSNRILNYQLRLTNSLGVAVPDGTKNLKLTVYDSASGGTQLYTACSADGSATGTPTAAVATFDGGTSSLLLGDTSIGCASGTAVAIPSTLFSNNAVWLGVTVESDAEMTPRKRIVAAGYALNADRLDDLETSSVGGSNAFVPVTDATGNFTLTKNVTFDTNTFYLDASTDRVGIGTTAPSDKLEVVGDIVSKGTAWTSRISAADNNWVSVTYGNGLFVAVANTGVGDRVMTSPDGINWTSRTSAEDNNWLGVTYGNGLFVAVADTGAGDRVMTSPDGINWTSRTSAADNNWVSVTYGNGLFVAVAYTGAGDRVMTSPDGITWTLRSSAADNGWRRVTYGNGLFVAVALDGTDRVMTSPDGIAWTARTAAAANIWVSVAYGNGLFVATASSGAGNRVMTSPDGITWTLRSSAADNVWFSIAYGNGMFAAVSTSGVGNRVMTSGKTEFNAPSANNIFQGGMSIFGNVGIGTATPGAKLDVRGTVSLGSATSDTITFNGYVGSHFVPTVDDTYDLGSSTNRWRDLYLGPASLHIGTSASAEGLITYTDATQDVLNVATDATGGADVAFFTNQLYLDKSTGNVGIGSTAPAVRLEVAGSGFFNLENSLWGFGSQNQAQMAVIKKGGQNAMIAAAQNEPLIFGKSNATAANLMSTAVTGQTLTEFMRISSGGNVGVGTNNPLQILHVNKSGAGSQIGLALTNPNGASNDEIVLDLTTNSQVPGVRSAQIAGVNIGGGNAMALAFKTQNLAAPATRMYIDQIGNVGIGTTSPAVKFEVSNISNAMMNLTNSAAAADAVGADLRFMNTTNYLGGVNVHYRGGTANNQIDLDLMAGGDAATPMVTIEGSGNVGIGTTGPSAKLDVRGSVSLGAASTDTLTFSTNTLAVPNNLNIDSNTLFVDAANNRVGMGNSAPSYQLDVSGSVSVGPLNLQNTTGVFNSTDTHPVIYGTNNAGGSYPFLTAGNLVLQSRPSGADRDIVFVTGTAAAARMVVSGTGNVGIGTTTPASKLSVSVATGANALELIGTGTGAQSWQWAPTASQTLVLSRPGLRLAMLGNDGSFAAGGLSTDGGGDADLYLDGTSGFLGLGITSPTAKLDVRGSVSLGSATTDTLTIDGYIGSDFIPTTDDTYDLGSPAFRWRDLFLGPATLHVGTSTADEGTITYDTATNKLQIDTTAGGSVDIAGGSGSSGCSVDASGNFVCSGVIQSGTGVSFVNNGNSFGGAAILGTNDANSLSFETSNSTRLTIASGGGFTLPVDTNWTLSGGVNGLSFDGPTFSVDASNDRIGIGSAAPTATLQVVGDLRVGTGGAYADLRLFTDTTLAGYNQTNSLTPLTIPGSGTAKTALRLKNAVSTGTNQIDLIVDGNVGIGTTTVGSQLTVGSTGGFTVNASGAITAATGITSSGTINFSGLTGSKGVFTDSSKNLTSTGTLGVDQGGTGTGTAFTSGSVVFAGASGVYGQSNADFFWDNTNKRLGIGTTTPSGGLQVKQTNTSGTLIPFWISRTTSGGDYLPLADFGTGGNGGWRINQNSAGANALSTWTVWDASDDRWEAQASTSVGATLVTMNTNGGIYFNTSPSTAVTAGDPVNFNNTLSLLGNGNVGVGTATPIAQFQVIDSTIDKIAVIVRGAAPDNTADFQQWQRYDGLIYSFVDAVGRIHVNSPGTANKAFLSAGTGSYDIQNTSFAATPGHIAWNAVNVQGLAGQTADLQVWQNSSATTIASVAASGAIMTSADLAVNGGNITTTNIGTTSIFNSNATTLNIGGAATTINLGSAAGTAALAGALTVAGNTALGNASTDTLTFNANTLAIPNNLNVDANTLFVDAANNRVGIGTTTPLWPLQVNGRIRTEADFLSVGGAGMQIWKDGTPTTAASIGLAVPGEALTDDIVFSTYNPWVEVMRITNGGSVGIGSTSPSARLDVAGTVKLGSATTDTLTFNGYVGSHFIPTTDDTYDLGSSAYRWRDLYLGPASIHMGGVGDEAKISYNTALNRMEFDANGDGTPETYVDGSGNLTATGTVSSTSTGTTAFSGNLTVGGNTTLGDASTDTLTFNANTLAAPNNLNIDSNTLFIDSANNRVGVNNATPAAKLDVKTGVAPFIALKISNYDSNVNSLFAGAVDDTSIFLGTSYYFNSNLYRTPGTAAAIARFDGGAFKIYTDSGLTADTDYTPTERLRITSAGDVGIGTAGPTHKLTVVGGQIAMDNATGLLAKDSGGTYRNIFNANSDNSVSYGDGAGGWTALRFFPGAAEAMRITSAGSVGIGTSSPNVRLGQKLDIATSANYGGAALSTWSATAAQASILDFSRSKSATIGTQSIVASDDALGSISFRGSTGSAFVDAAGIQAFVDGTPGASDMPGRLEFLTSPDGTTNLTERMRIDNAGNVGIGTSIPGAKLDVSGSANVTGTLTVSDAATFNKAGLTSAAANSFSAGTNVIAAMFGSGSTAGFTADQYGGAVRFNGATVLWGDLSYYPNGGGNGNQGHFRLSTTGSILSTAPNAKLGVGDFYAAGNVGIGTASPAAKLQVNSNAYAAHFGEGAGGAGIDVKNRLAAVPTSGTIATLAWLESTSGLPAGTLLLGSRPGVGGVLISGSGTADLYVTPTGNVGIGTTGPSSRLHVYRDADSANRIIFQNANTGTSASTQLDLIVQHDTANDPYIRYQIAASGRAWSEGMDNSDSDKFKISLGDTLGSADKLVIDTVGNVGIGTASPASLLDLSSASTELRIRDTGTGQSVIRFYKSGTTEIGAVKSLAADNSLAFEAGSPASEVMRIKSGNVGIGTTSPSVKLDIVGGTGILQSSNDTDATLKTSRVGVKHYTNAEEPFYWALANGNTTTNDLFLGGGTSLGNAATGVFFYTAANSTTTTGSERMRINASGNVGIGTNNPTARLQVEDSSYGFRIGKLSSGNRNLIEALGPNTTLITSPASTYYIIDSDNNGSNDGFFIGRDAATDSTATVDMAVVEGNVGIGTSAPSVRLEVNGSMKLSAGNATYGITLPERGQRITVGTYGTISETLGGAAYVTGNNIASSQTASNTLIKTYSQTDGAQFVGMRYDRGIWFGTGIGTGDAVGTTYADSVNARMSIGLTGDVGIGGTITNLSTMAGAGMVVTAAGAISSTRLLTGDGTAGAPAHSFTNSADMGLYRVNATNLGIAVGGSQVVNMGSSGLTAAGFGITGVTSAISGGFRLATSGELQWGQTPDLNIVRDSAGVMRIGDGSTGRGTLTVGKLGVAMASSTNYGLVVSSGATDSGARIGLATIGSSGTGYPVMGDNIRFTGTNGSYLYDRTDTAAMVDFDLGNMVFRTAPSGSSGAAITFTPRMTVLNTGNVGIGTASPTTKLDVQGAVSVPGDSGGYYRFRTASNSEQGWIKYVGDTELQLNANRGGNSTVITFLNQGAERMRISDSGNVGIGTNASDSILHVAQPATGYGTVTTNGTTTLTGTGTQFRNTFKVGDTITVSGETVRTIDSITDDSTLTVTVAFSTSVSGLSYALTGGNRFVVKGNGNIGIGTTNPLGPLHIVGNVGSLTGGMLFGDGDSGLYEAADDEIRVNLASAAKWRFTTSAFGGVTTGHPLLLAAVASLTSPTVLPYGSDTNTGIGADGSDNLSLITAGAGRLTVDSAGDVGIGTATPDYKLDVAGTGHFSGQVTMDASVVFNSGQTLQLDGGSAVTPSLNFGGASDTDTGLYRVTANTLGFSTDGAVRAVIDGSGNAGVGTSGPLARLHVSRAGEDVLNLSNSSSGVTPDWVVAIGDGTQHAAGQMVFAPGTGASTAASKSLTLESGGLVLIGNSTNSILQPAGSMLTFRANSTTATDLFRITTNNQGNLAKTSGTQSVFRIGQTFAPTSGTAEFVALNLAPTVNQTGTASGDYAILRIRPTITASTGTSKYLIQAGTETSPSLFTLTEAGNVGIGTTSPITRLDLAGNLRTTGKATAALTGSIDPIASTTVTGVGTLFTTQLVVGDRVTVTGQTRMVTAIASDTSLTVDTAFSDNANDTSPDVLYALMTIRDSSNASKLIMNDLGTIIIPASQAINLSGGTGPGSISHNGTRFDFGSRARTAEYWESTSSGAALYASNATGLIEFAGPSKLLSDIADGATAVAAITDTSNTFSNASAKLLSIRNNTVEKAYVDINGMVVSLAASGSNAFKMSDGARLNFSTADASAYLYRSAANTISTPGSLTVSGNATLGDASTDALTFNGYVGSHFIPTTDDTYDLGTAALRWRDLYLGPASIHMGAAGDESKITYNTTSNRIEFDANGDGGADTYIDSSGNLTATGTITSTSTGTAAYSGNLTVAGNTTLGDSVSDTTAISGVLTVAGDSGYGSSIRLVTATNVVTDVLDIGEGSRGGGLRMLENGGGTILFSLYTRTTTNVTERLTVTEAGNIGLGTTSPNSLFQVTQRTTAVGSVATNGTTTLTGTNTQFTNTFKVGDTVTVSGETVRTIASIASDTSLTVSVAFSTTASGLTYTLTGGTRFVVKGNGNVGIGTATPTATLHVTGNIRIQNTSDTTYSSGLRWSNSADTQKWALGPRINVASDDFEIADGASTRLIVKDSTGNVGIGTTGPVRILQIGANAANDYLRIMSNNNSGVEWTDYSNNARWSITRPVTGGQTNSLVIRDTGNGVDRAYINYGAVADIILNPTNGNVGIGTTGPSYPLDVVGDLRASGYIRGSASGLYFPTSGQVQTAGGDLALNATSGSMLYKLNGVEKMRLDSTGNVGIGTTTAGSLLTVGSTGQFTVSSAGNLATSGTVTFSGLTASRGVFTTTGGQLTTSGTSQYLIDSLSDETGSGAAVFGTSPAITTSLTTGSTSFDLLNTTATTINFGGGATTALNIGPGSTTATNVNLAGGSAATGCTVAGASGNLNCSGTITAGASIAIDGSSTPRTVTSDTSLSVLTTGANALRFDTGGAAAVTIGDTNASAVGLGRAGITTSVTGKLSTSHSPTTGSADEKAFDASVLSNRTGGNSYGAQFTATESNSSNNANVYGLNVSATQAGTSANTVRGINVTAGASGTSNSVTLYGVKIDDAGSAASSAGDHYGLRIDTTTGSAGTHYGVYSNVSGGAAAYSGVFMGGNVGIGTTSPGTKLTVQTSASNDGLTLQDGTRWMKMLSGTAGTGSYNPIVQANDNAIIYSAGTEGTGYLSIAPWSSSLGGIRMDASGNVGIGTTGPGEKLHVSGGQIAIGGNAQSRVVFRNEAESANGFLVGRSYLSNNANDFFIYDAVNTTARLYISSDGKVGIGSTSPTMKLDVNGSLRATELINGQKLNFTISEKYGDATANNYKIATLPLSASTTFDHVVVDLASGGWLGSEKHLIHALFGNRNGFTYAWDMMGALPNGCGTLRVYNNSGVSEIYVYYPASAWCGGATVSVTLPNQATVITSPTDVGASPTGTLIFDSSTPGTYPPTVVESNTGNVGIGTTNSSDYAKLYVYGTGSGLSNGIQSDNTTAGGTAVVAQSVGSSSTGVYAAGTSYDFYAVGSGTDYGSSSSVRWKTNVVNISGGLEKVLALRGVYYDWDQDHGGTRDMGMIAEEVGAIVPEIVQWDPEEPGYATGMDYGHLTPVLIEGIKGLNAITLKLDAAGTTYLVDKTAAASALEPVKASKSVVFRGSAWDATADVSVDLAFTNKVSDKDTYRLSLTDTLGTEVAYFGSEGDVAIKGNFFPSDRGTLQNSKYIYYDGSEGIGGDMMRTNAAGWGTGSYDFAEMFPSADALESGDLVMVDVSAVGHVKKADNSTETNGYLLTGIISTRPGFLAGMNDVGSFPVALQGRVPAKVGGENGDVKIGDPITASSVPGVGQKAEPGSYVVGIALESYDATDDLGQPNAPRGITVFVRAGWFNGKTVTTAVTDPSATSQLSNSVTSLIDMKGQPIIGIGALEGIGGLWRLDGNGKFVTSAVEADSVQAGRMQIEMTEETQTTGEGVMTVGNSSVIVHNAAVQPNSRIFVTFYGNTEGSWWISRRTDGEFEISMSKVAVTDLKFEYWILGVVDNRPAPAAVELPPEPPADEPVPTDGGASSSDATADTVPPVDTGSGSGEATTDTVIP